MVVYEITNLINGKKYIGMDTHNNPNYLGSGSLILKAIKKYGRQNFKKIIIEHCSNIEELEKRETYWINFYDSYHKGYNATPIAGNCKGRPVSEETRLKIMKSLKGRKVVRTVEHNINNGKSRRKIVFQYNKVGDIINTFESTYSAAKFLSVTQPTISANCLGIQRSRNFIVSYA